jgi:hypothetical protein
MVEFKSFFGRKVMITFLNPVVFKGTIIHKVKGKLESGAFPGVGVVIEIESTEDLAGQNVAERVGLKGMGMVFNSGNIQFIVGPID